MMQSVLKYGFAISKLIVSNKPKGAILNGKSFSGIKKEIEFDDRLIIPQKWQYNVQGKFEIEGQIEIEGQLNIK